MTLEKIVRRPTIDHYTKFMLEDKDGLSPHRRMELHKSNLILNFRYMERKDRKKAAIEIVTCELQLASEELELSKNCISPGERRFSIIKAANNFGSALNWHRHCKFFNPTIANLLIKRAWDSRNMHIILEEEKIILDDYS